MNYIKLFELAPEHVNKSLNKDYKNYTRIVDDTVLASYETPLDLADLNSQLTSEDKKIVIITNKYKKIRYIINTIEPDFDFQVFSEMCDINISSAFIGKFGYLGYQNIIHSNLLVVDSNIWNLYQVMMLSKNV